MRFIIPQRAPSCCATGAPFTLADHVTTGGLHPTSLPSPGTTRRSGFEPSFFNVNVKRGPLDVGRARSVALRLHWMGGVTGARGPRPDSPSVDVAASRSPSFGTFVVLEPVDSLAAGSKLGASTPIGTEVGSGAVLGGSAVARPALLVQAARSSAVTITVASFRIPSLYVSARSALSVPSSKHRAIGARKSKARARLGASSSG